MARSQGVESSNSGERRALLLSLLGLKQQEVKRVGFMFLYLVLAVGGIVITGSVVGRSLFLSAIPKSAIPLKFILPPLVTVFIAAKYSSLANRYRTDKLIRANLILSSAVLIGFRAGLSTPLANDLVFLCALFVFFDVIVTIGMLQFWTLAGELFNPREAKRGFSLIAAGGTVASILFGSILNRLSDHVASKDLIFLMLACLAGVAWCVRQLRQECDLHLRVEAAAPSEKAPSLAQSVRALRSDPLLLSISVLVMIVAQVSCVADYQLDLAIQNHFGSDSQKMVGFLGQFRFWTGIAAALVQLFLASRLLARFGLKAALLILPLAMGSGSVAVLVTGGLLWAVLMPRGTDLIFKYTINQTAFNLLYLPVKPNRQRQAKVLISGILNPAMVCFLGISFYLVERYLELPLMAWSYLILLLIIIWIWTAVRAAGFYVGSLQDSIRKRGFKSDWEATPLVGEQTKAVLQENLNHSDTRSVIHSLDLLEQLPELDWSQELSRLLNHEESVIRKRALELVSHFTYGQLAEQVEPCHKDSDPEVAAAALHCSCHLLGVDAVSLVSPYLDSKLPSSRAAAISGLMLHGGLDGILSAAEHLKSLLESPQQEERIAGAEVLGELGVKSFRDPILRLLVDPSDEVRAAAIKAAGKFGDRGLVNALIEKLDEPSMRNSAARALSQCIGDQVSLLTPKLSHPDTTPPVKIAILKVLESQSSDDAVELVWEQLNLTQGSTRTVVCQTLIRLRRDGKTLPGRPDDINRLLQEEVEVGYRFCSYMREDSKDDLLDTTLVVRLQQTCQRLLALLALIYPRISLACLNASLYHRGDRLRSYGLELLDNVLEGETKKLVFPLFSASLSDLREDSFEKLNEEPKTRFRQLHDLCTHEDWWLRTCALYCLGLEGDGTDIPAVKRSLTAENSMERDTAWRSLQHLSEAEAFKELCQEQEHLLTGTNYLDSLHPTKGGGKVALSDLEELLFLRTVPLFSELTNEDLAGIVPITHEVHFEEGDKLIEQGEHGDCLYVVVEGEVQISMEGEEVSICKSPDTLGELSILGERPRSADCVAQSEVVALRLDKSDFWVLLDERPEIAKGVIRMLLKYT